eukprot:SAG22_NODE_2778_length_2218_cov_14.689476_1_plen_101_part_00
MQAFRTCAAPLVRAAPAFKIVSTNDDSQLEGKSQLSQLQTRGFAGKTDGNWSPEYEDFLSKQNKRPMSPSIYENTDNLFGILWGVSRAAGGGPPGHLKFV